MSEFIVDPFLLVRAPAYSYENFNESFLQQVLTTDFFRASLFFASQTLYIELKKKNFDYTQFNEQVKTTLWKYLNRMCFRPLPYGLFSSFSLAMWTSEQQSMLFSGRGQLTAIPDFVSVLDYVKTLKQEDLPFVKYHTNNSMYTVAGELYFVSQAYTEQANYVIVHLKVVPGLKELLKFISRGQRKDAILNYLIAKYGEDAGAEDYFKHLVNGQVIVSELMPNVTGMLYSERCSSLLKAYTQFDLNAIKTFSFGICNQNQALPELNTHLEEVIDRNENNAPYSLYQREISGGLSENVHPEFISLLKNLNKLTTDHNEGGMNKFKAAFVKKYDRREVALMEVMDPGVGIGYENLASAFDNQNDEFIEDLKKPVDSVRKVNWGETEIMLFEKWNNLSRSGSDKIMLSQEDINQLPESKSLLPPGMFILFKNVDHELWIDEIGGVSGIELGGRFGINDPAVNQKLKSICEQEMAINNDFIFAEIAFSPTSKASNIKQRAHFFPYEIPILTHSTRSEKETIRLNDLVISIVGNTILLRSIKLNRFIIPRLSSAYNVTLTGIPVFRFLCELQYQGVKTRLSFSLANLFPNLNYYPRVQLGNNVLSPATWIINQDKINKIVTQDIDLVENLHLPAYFTLHERDNFLVFNKNNKDDLDMFRKCIRNKKSIIVKEYVFPENADLLDTEKQPYMSQCIACVVNKSKVYVTPRSKTDINRAIKKLGVKRTFFPGEQWLYLKLYAHDSLVDAILMNSILPVIQKYKNKNSGFKWFFIRYNDPEPHLRLRFFINENSVPDLLSELNSQLKPFYRSGKIAEVLVDTYQRELERYSVELIEEIESFFYRDSEYILSAFQSGGVRTRFKLNFAIHSVLLMVRCFIKDKKQRIAFFNIMLDGFAAEFNNRDKEAGRKMDLKYRNFQSELIDNEQFSILLNNKYYPDFNQILISLSEKLLNWKPEDKYSLIASLIHMHMNRTFESHPREYECLAYHFMKKHQAYLNYTTNDEF
ncbi:thiopeptide-type bacteriocin biosynthesis protein [Pedobacter cryoconitis]|uniref:Thiopeptide-type bacteriocin biosynthesis protein n=1 Tax=Pedobacter cryoconitis TaxID=188932 RepID=A0A7W8YRW6_9SPHI|nr:lantibiotic dehydratase [Pedobacter cryoconitis]MBB5620537.1 thiopeptide-type bacteriocin biosynthesis protein [Pedobacter cryoconitis]